MSTRRILLVEGDEQYRRLLEEICAEHETIVVGTANQAYKAALDETFDMVVCSDLLDDGGDGLRLLKQLGEIQPAPQRVLLTDCDGDIVLQARSEVSRIHRHEVAAKLSAILSPEEAI